MERLPLAAIALSVLHFTLPQCVNAQGTFNGTFEDDNGQFSLSGWTWDCEDPEAGPAYMSYWGVQKLTAVTGVPPDPCSGVTVMQHPIADSTEAIYTISGWAYVDDPNMSASIGFGYLNGFGGMNHQGDYTNSTTWDWLQFLGTDAELFQGFAPMVTLATSDGLNGFGYAHYDDLVLDIQPIPTGLGSLDRSTPRVSLSPDGAQLVIWSNDRTLSVARICDPLGRLELTAPVMERSADAVLVSTASLPPGLHVLMLGEREVSAVRFVKP